MPPVKGDKPTTSGTTNTKTLRFSYNVWSGWLPVIAANHGTKANDESIFFKKYNGFARLVTYCCQTGRRQSLDTARCFPPTITLDAGRDTVNKIRAVIASYPPVRTVALEQGHGEDATDPDWSDRCVAGFFVPLKPFEEWPAGLTKPKLVKELSARLESEFIGIDFNFSRNTSRTTLKRPSPV